MMDLDPQDGGWAAGGPEKPQAPSPSRKCLKTDPDLELEAALVSIEGRHVSAGAATHRGDASECGGRVSKGSPKLLSPLSEESC